MNHIAKVLVFVIIVLSAFLVFLIVADVMSTYNTQSQTVEPNGQNSIVVESTENKVFVRSGILYDEANFGLSFVLPREANFHEKEYE